MDDGPEQAVTDDRLAQALRRKAVWIYAQSALIGLGLAGLCLVLPF